MAVLTLSLRGGVPASRAQNVTKSSFYQQKSKTRNANVSVLPDPIQLRNHLYGLHLRAIFLIL